MKRLRILFDGVEVNETPDGWQDIVSSITRKREINSLFITNEAKLTFQSDGYDYLLAKYNDGFCSSVATELQEFVGGVYQPFFIGIIYLKSAEIDRQQCTIQVDVEDNSFYAKIDNNKSIEVFPFGQGTKSSASDPLNTQYDLPACAYQKIQLFDPNDGSTIGVLVNPPYSGAAYPINDLFAYMISFVSDNTVSYRSPLFGSGGDYEGLTITIGIMLRQYIMGGTTEDDWKNNFPKISFQQLFTEVNKKVNIGMYVDYSNPLPTVVIDRVAKIRTDQTIFRALNILGLKESIDQETLYSSVRLGSTTTDDKVYSSPETGLLFPENISFVGFKEEQFLVLSQCNIDRELDLVSQWIISANVIEDCFIHGENSFDNFIIFVMCDKVGANYIARQSNLEGQAALFPVFYNLDLNGAAVMNNYFGGVPLSIAQYLGNRDETFLATRTTNQSPTFNVHTVILFDDDSTPPNYDFNNNYDPVTGRYTIPLNGLYTFDALINLFYTPISGLTYEVIIYMERYDSGSVLLQSIEVGRLQGFGLLTGSYSHSFSCTQFDYVIVSFQESYGFGQVVVSPNSTYSCGNSQDGGGIYQTFDPQDYPAILHRWEYPLTFGNFKGIAQNQTGQIEFSRFKELHYSGWIDSVKFKRFSDEKAQFVTYRSKRLPVTSNIPFEIRQVQIGGQLPNITFAVDNTDYYGNPFGGNSSITKTFFYLVGQQITLTIPSTFLGAAAGNPSNITIYVTKFTPAGTTAVQALLPDLSFTFTIESNTNYQVLFGYNLTGVGNTFPSVYPLTSSPVTAGANGTATIVCVLPNNPADYTFLWSTGAITVGISAPAGNYTCLVTNTNPGTFDTNSMLFNIQIPVSETGA